jgi:Glyoxalase-like domain
VSKPIQVTFDCANPPELAAFWAEALGYTVEPPPPGFESWEDFLQAHSVPADLWDSRSAVVDPDGDGPRLFFQRVPEGKTVKNRVHLDVKVAVGLQGQARRDAIDAEVERLQAHRARVLRPLEEWDTYCVVMADPEDNEFCVD